jgi:hypothetical protein
VKLLKAWSRSEVHARDVLEERLGKQLRKRRLIVGYAADGTPNEHEFDLVSEEGDIIGEVKSGRDMNDYRFAECCLDCLYLMSVETEKRIFVLTDEVMYEWVKKKISGLAIKGVEIMLIETPSNR